MSRSRTSSSEQKIHPKSVKWKFFYYNQEAKEIQCCYEKEAVPAFVRSDETQVKRNQVAILTTASFFGEFSKTPDSIKRVVETALFYEGRPSEFCIALPYQEDYERDYYEKDYKEEDYKIRPIQRTHYSNVVVHDNFITTRNMAYMSPKGGAAQIASAIENGFHIHCLTGGVQAEAKLALVRDYFRSQPLRSGHPRKIFVGMSDNSEYEFGLKELVEFVHARNAGRTFIADLNNPERETEGTREIIKIFESQQDQHFKRKISCGDSETFNQIQSRFVAGDQVRYHTYFPRQIISAIDSPYRPDFSKEKLILGLEGYLQSETGYNASEALEVALQSGVVKPEQVIAVVIENIVVVNDEMAVRRINGHIPQYHELTAEEKNKILEIFPGSESDSQEDRIRQYTTLANTAFDNEVNRIREVAKRNGIPVLLGGEVRSGHAKNYQIQPVYVRDINFSEGQIVVNSTIRHNTPVTELAPKATPEMIEPKKWHPEGKLFSISEEQAAFTAFLRRKQNYPYSKTATTENSENSDLNNKISQLRLIKGNSAAEVATFDAEQYQVVVGNAGNISERSLQELNGKGLICIMSARADGSAQFDQPKLQNSGRLGASEIIDFNPDYQIPFVIFAAQNPEAMNKDVLRPVLQNFDLQVPVFFATNLSQEMLEGLPALFEAKINIKEMLHGLKVHEAARLDGKSKEVNTKCCVIS